MHHSRVIFRALVGALIVVTLTPVAAFAIPRDTVIARGKVWVDKKVPYSQSRYATVAGSRIPTSTPLATAQKQGYRTDCSGFVSMCLDLKTSKGLPLSLATATFRSVLTTITKDQLLPGDVILRPSTGYPYGHAVLFVKWSDSTHTSYWSYEESSGNKGAITRLVTYPFFTSVGFKAYRYNKIDDYYADCQESVYGPTRYETAVAASRVAFPETSTATVRALVVTNGETWTGNLGGAALAGASGGPLLLSSRTSLPTTAAATIKRLKPQQVIVIGGSPSVAKAITDKIEALGPDVTRISGGDRYITTARAAQAAVTLARADGHTVDAAYLVGSDSFSDGIAVSPISARTSRPILLTRRTSIPAATLEALKKTGIKRVYVVGGTGSISNTVVAALKKRGFAVARKGSDSRYYTALSVARHGAGIPGAGLTWDRLGIASGTALTGSLACGVAQGQAGSLLLFTPGTKLYSGAAAEITERRAGISKVRVFGSYNVIGMTVRSSIAKLMRAK